MKRYEMSSFIRLVLLSMLLGCCSQVDAAVYYVRVSGSDLAAGASKDTAFQTVDKALTTAVSGDQIYIGAGTYTVDAQMNGQMSSTSGWTMIYGDTLGNYTGDAGEVRIRSKANRWAMDVRNCSYLYVYGLSFESPESAVGNYYGIRTSGISGYFYVNNCSFSGLRYGMYSTSPAAVYAVGSSFEGNTYGIYTNESSLTYGYYCKFADERYGIRVLNTDQFMSYGNEFSNCYSGIESTNAATMTVDRNTFVAGVSDDGTTLYNIAIRSTGSNLTVRNVQCTSPSYGVLGYDLTGLSVSNCAFAEPKSYAVYATGTGMSLTDVTIDGNETKGGNGIRLTDTSGKEPALQNVTVSGVSSALVIPASCDFKNVEVTGNRYGINFAAGGGRLKLDATSGIKLIDNDYAIYANHGSQPDGVIELDGYTITDNNHGLYAYSVDVEFSNSSISGNSNGCYVYRAPRVSIANCDFDRNTREGGSTTNAGLYVSADSITIEKSSFSGNRHGLQIQNLTDESPKLSDLKIDENSYHGLLMTDGNWELAVASNLQLTSNRYGVYTRNVDWSADGIDFGSTNTYPCIDVGGSVKLRNCTVSGGVYGFYGSRSKVFDVESCEVTGATTYGIYGYYPEKCRLHNVSATKCNSAGARIYATDETTPEISDSTFSDNTQYGLVIHGSAVGEDNVKNLVCENNRYGLRVYDNSLTLNAKMNVQVSGNYYGVLVNNGDMRLDSVDIRGNDVGVYAYNGNCSVTGCSVSSSYHGLLLYPFDEQVAKVAGCKLAGGTGYGVYIAGYDSTESHSVSDVNIDSFSGYGIYTRSARGDRPVVDVSDVQVSNCGTGIYVNNSDVTVRRGNITKSRSYGIYQTNAIGRYQDVTVDTTGSWGIIGYGPLMELTRAKVKDSRHGVALLVEHGNMINSVVDGGTYGVYLNKVDGVFNVLQSTLANITSYGVLHYNGTATVENCIIDSANYGLRATGSSGSLTHDHTLVHADRTPFYGQMDGIDEINKDPIFKDPTNGDLSLAAGSPAINAGKDLSAVLMTDIDGNARNSFRQFEIGAYEYTEAAGSLRVLDWDETAK